MATLTVYNVADYFLTHQDPAIEPMSNMKLQKLVYLAQGTTLAKYGHLSASELSSLTHHHDPWVVQWGKAQARRTDDVIPEPELESYFTRLWVGHDGQLSPNRLSTAIRAHPESADEDARAAAEIAAGRGMSLGELRRFLDM